MFFTCLKTAKWLKVKGSIKNHRQKTISKKPMIKLPNGLQADGTIHIVLMIETSQ
jgi:hypothetical protein